MALMLPKFLQPSHLSIQTLKLKKFTHSPCYFQTSSFVTLLTDKQLKKSFPSDFSSELTKSQYLKLTVSSSRSFSGIKIFDNLKQLPQSPAAALCLGVAGLLPFAAAPYMMLSSGQFLPDVALYQSYYGATILSFLGGVRWGFTVPAGSPQNPDLNNLCYSVLPQLWGCSCLVLGHYMDCIVVANAGVTLGLCMTGFMDLSMPGYPAWFKGMRFCLTVGATVSLLFVLMGKFVLVEKNQDKSSESM